MFSERVQYRKIQQQNSHAAVLEAAAELFHDQGFRSTTVRQIASLAGVSIGTVMSVGDKEGLLVTVMDQRIALMHQERQLPETGFLAMKAGNDAPEMIAALVEPFLLLFAANLDLARDYAAILIRGTHESAVFGSLASRLKQEFEQVFRLFGLPVESARRAATTVHLAYLGILLSWAAGAYDRHTAVAQLQAVVSGTVDWRHT